MFKNNDNNIFQFIRSGISRFITRVKIRFGAGGKIQDGTQAKEERYTPSITGAANFSGSQATKASGTAGGVGGGGGGGGGSISGSFSGDGRVKDQEADQIVDVNYGHDGGGKVYTYKSKGAAVGKNVTAPVTHWRSGKNYKTLAVIRRVQDAKSVGGEAGVNERRKAAGFGGISLKYIGPEDMNQYVGSGSSRKLVFSPKLRLPGWSKYSKGRTHAQASEAWRQDSKRRQQERYRRQMSR